jgi:hypothetical protein
VFSLFKAYPGLEHFGVRGGQDLSMQGLNLENLKTLGVYTGGLPKSVIKQIGAASLPNLENLVLFLGVDEYGGDHSLEDLQPFFDGANFPKLQYLGLCDSEYADEIAKAIANAPVLSKLSVLDLSLGTMTDEGGKALLDSPAVKNLKKLELQYHYMSTDMMTRLKGLGIEVDVSDRQEAEEYDGELWRYPAVTE